MDLHPRHYHYDTVAYSGRKPRGIVQSCVGYRVCFGARHLVLSKSCDVEVAQDAGGVLYKGGREKGGVGGKKGYIYSTYCDYLVQLVRYDNVDSYPALCWLKNTNGPAFILHNHQAPHEREALRRDLVLVVMIV